MLVGVGTFSLNCSAWSFPATASDNTAGLTNVAVDVYSTPVEGHVKAGWSGGRASRDTAIEAIKKFDNDNIVR